MEFVNLYLQTEYSLTQSPIKLDELIQKAKEYDYKALAITDVDNMYGVLKFYNKCVNSNIKPIIGLNLTLSSRDNFYNNVLLYAMNNNGYRNLLKIATLRKTNKELYLPNIVKYTSDIILVIPNEENEIIKLFYENNYQRASEIAFEYRKYFEYVYLGLDLQTKESCLNFNKLVAFGGSLGIKCVALNKTHYLNRDDLEVYKVLREIGLSISDYVPSEKEENGYFISKNEGIDLFRKYPNLITNTIEIMEMCNVRIEVNGYKMPVFDNNIDSNIYIKELSYIGLKKRLENNKVNKKEYGKYVSRLDYELDIIDRMGFNDYFLIVYDFIKYAKKSGILVGPGRGSGPGSLVAYSLGITEVDPIEHGLLFERFLNPERVSMPDIDTDFPDTRRDEVIKYMGKKYGKKRVAHIGTFGTFGPRLAIRDVARAMGLSNIYLDEVLAYVPNTVKTVRDSLENPVFLKMYQENDIIRYLVDIVIKLENLPRHVSIHAAGIIMADDDLDEYTALQEGINGLYQTQFEASDLEMLGLVKIDFLGLKNLTIIDDVLKIVNQNECKIGNINRIPFDDPDVYKMIASGDTDGIFQLESSGMRSVLQRLKTSEFKDIVNAIALYRPGPMEMIPSFINRKFGNEKIEYLHPDLEEILKPTYGAIVYQEQILLIAQKFAGYSLGEADILRRAVSKKKSELLLKEKDKFIAGAIKKGYSKELSETIYNYILKFANYGFNKSHSVVYSVISYQMAYLKAKYYKEFMTVMMSNSIGKNHLLKGYFSNCSKRKITVFPPLINRSTCAFYADERGIFCSLLMIEGLGETTVNNLVLERIENGDFKDYDDFVMRTKNIVSKKNVEMLIYSGALDEFKIPRKQMKMEYDKSLELANYGDLFRDQLKEHVYSDEEYTFEEISSLEREALGINVKFDIFKQYNSLKAKYKTVDVCDLVVGNNIRVLCVIDRINVIKTKKGDEMAFMSVSDDTGAVDCVIFPNNYQEMKEELETSKMALIHCKVENRESKLQCVVEKIMVKKY